MVLSEILGDGALAVVEGHVDVVLELDEESVGKHPPDGLCKLVDPCDPRADEGRLCRCFWRWLGRSVCADNVVLDNLRKVFGKG